MTKSKAQKKKSLVVSLPTTPIEGTVGAQEEERLEALVTVRARRMWLGGGVVSHVDGSRVLSNEELEAEFTSFTNVQLFDDYWCASAQYARRV